jgi:hypothetical protein
MAQRPSSVVQQDWIKLFQAIAAVNDPSVWRRIDGARTRLDQRDAKLQKPTRTPSSSRR